MLRYTAWALLALYLLTVGLWPAALAPVTLTLAGLGAVIATIPPSVLLLAAVVAWLKHRPTPAKVA
ncbi:predicted protein [Streptomyces viridosporus ATCC 14672]|uniref:Predicted protein n=1 Tax=Streptomyces viridosporus (strain ATCC 14672 / DSM 40746 / JCM 4963 / KCTC 9882 / NRRL B-12104 / FH 1290) TaxID=566461 RepID=D6A4F8_STRV1|nr:hypothetical protein [Streptomyces viridosporus]EFE65798.1 predicted protein [Streptomyces viridosporus ATCC 14672]